MHIREGMGIIAPSNYSLINAPSFAILNSRDIDGEGRCYFEDLSDRIELDTYTNESGILSRTRVIEINMDTVEYTELFELSFSDKL